jgi:hypothetical protein
MRRGLCILNLDRLAKPEDLLCMYVCMSVCLYVKDCGTLNMLVSAPFLKTITIIHYLLLMSI